VIGRASDQPVGGVRDRLHGAHAARKVLARAAAQPLQPNALAILLEGEEFALRQVALEVVERRDGARAVAKRRVRGYVVDPLGADIDDAAVAHAFELFAAGYEHGAPPIWCHFAAPSISPVGGSINCNG